MNAVLRAIEKAASVQDVINRNDASAYDREQHCQAINGPIYGKSFGKELTLRVEYHLMDRSQPFAKFNRISVEHDLPQNPTRAVNGWQITLSKIGCTGLTGLQI